MQTGSKVQLLLVAFLAELGVACDAAQHVVTRARIWEGLIQLLGFLAHVACPHELCVLVSVHAVVAESEGLCVHELLHLIPGVLPPPMPVLCSLCTCPC